MRPSRLNSPQPHELTLSEAIDNFIEVLKQQPEYLILVRIVNWLAQRL